MGFQGKILAAGELSNTLVPIYTCPALQTAYAKFFRIYNTNISKETIEIFIQVSGQPVLQQHRFPLLTYESAEIIDKDAAWCLSPGDSIYSKGTSTSGVTYMITGGVEV